MELPTDKNHVSCRSLETEFPKPIQSVPFVSLHGPSNSFILQQAVSFTSGPWGVDVKSNTLHTNKREAFLRWQNEYRQREWAVLHPSASELLRETAWYDPTQPSQQLKDSARWGTFIWRDKPVLGKEYVLSADTSVHVRNCPEQKRFAMGICSYSGQFLTWTEVSAESTVVGWCQTEKKFKKK